MSFFAVCPNCDARLTAPDNVLGRKFRCKKCNEPFVAKRDAEPDDDEDDDEPIPKAKKKGTKGKKQGLPLAVVLGVISGVLLIGGGIVVYFAFIKENKPADQPVAKADPRRTQPIGGGASGPVTEWMDWREVAGKYWIKFPTMPRNRTQESRGPNGENYDLVVDYWKGDTEEYMSAHKPVPDLKSKNLTTDYALDEAFSNKRLRPRGGVERSRTTITYQGYPGREMILDFPEKGEQGVARLVLAEDRVILLVAAGPQMSADSPKARAFFESLKIDPPSSAK